MLYEDALARYVLCGVEPSSVPTTLTLNYQMVIDRFLPLDMLPSLLYTFNMVNSDMVVKLECLAVVVNPYIGLWL